MNPEFYDSIMEELFNKGAIDVYITPIVMKKNRPANKLSVLTNDENLEILSETILRETTSFGVRYYEVERKILDRMFKNVNTEYGVIPLKYGILNGEILKTTPEYEACKKIAKEKNIPVRKVYRAAIEAFKEID